LLRATPAQLFKAVSAANTGGHGFVCEILLKGRLVWRLTKLRYQP
jgi:hypothetical protein